MKEESIIENVLSKITAVSKRFPATIFFALVCAIISAIFVYNTNNLEEDLLPVLMVSAVGLMFSLILHVVGEKAYLKPMWIWGLWALLAICLVLYYFYLSSQIVDGNPKFCVAFIYSGTIILGVLLVSYIPFLGAEDNQNYLNYNRKLFTGYITTAFFTSILFLGLCLALIAIDNLLKINVDGDVYAYLATWLYGLFFTYHFLGGFPAIYEKIEAPVTALMKAFAQYILVPIISLYAIILILYAFKNIINPMPDPEWTEWLILWFYIFGFLAFVLNLSINEKSKSIWASGFTKWYIYLIIPLSILVLISLWKSISGNGITELKYLLAIFSLYLISIGTYFIISKNEDYRWISLGLMIVSVICLYGPQNACSISVKSQINSLEKDLTQAGVMKDGLIVSKQKLGQDKLTAVGIKLDYLRNRDAFSDLQKWDKNQMVGDSLTSYNLRTFLDSSYQNYEQLKYLYNQYLPEIDLENYKTMLSIIAPEFSKEIEGTYITLSAMKDKILLKEGQETISILDLPELDEEALKKDKVLRLTRDSVQVDIYFTNLNFYSEGNKQRIEMLEGIAFLKK